MKIIVFLFLFLLSLTFLMFPKYQKSPNESEKGNGLANSNVIWSQEWHTAIDKNKILSKTASYTGSEFYADVMHANVLSIQAASQNIDYDTQLNIEVNGKEYVLQNADLSKKTLLIQLSSENQNAITHVHGSFFCTGMSSPCSITITKLQVDSGDFLRVADLSHVPKKLAVLGDSISLIYVAKNYSALLAKSLSYQLHNASYWGGTLQTKNGKEPAIMRYQKDIVAYHPDAIVILLGINDIKYVPTSLNDFKTDYTAMVADMRTQLPYAKIILMGILPEKDEITDEEMIQQYNDAIFNLADGAHVFFVDTKGWLQAPDYLDQYHPTQIGEEKLFHQLEAAIRVKKIL